MRVRKPLVAGNWKMNLLVAVAVKLVEGLKPLVREVSGVDIVVCPTFTALYAVGQALKGSNIELAGQNCYVKESGAFTGEISPQMLLDVGCTWTMGLRIEACTDRSEHTNSEFGRHHT